MTNRLVRGAAKLSEVRRKDRRIERASLFVEKLYGRPLVNDPLVIMTPNRPTKEEWIGFEESFRTGKKPLSKRKMKLMEGEIKQITGGIEYRDVGALYLSDSNIVWVLDDNKFATGMVHELIHSEDFSSLRLWGKPLKSRERFLSVSPIGFLIQNIVIEARASFGANIFGGKELSEGSFERLGTKIFWFVFTPGSRLIDGIKNLRQWSSPNPLKWELWYRMWKHLSNLSTILPPEEVFKFSTEHPPQSISGILLYSHLASRKLFGKVL